MEKNSNFYNEVYLKGGSKQEYFKEPKDCIYYPIWNHICFGLNNVDKILELGCGVGQLAKLFINYNKNYIRGIDFSKIAIKKAKENNIGNESKFIIGNLYNKLLYEIDYDIVIICEVLEHLKDDLFIINNIKKDKKIIFSVPNYNSKGHVRYFSTWMEANERYRNLIEFKNPPILFKLNEKNHIYLFEGIKN